MWLRCSTLLACLAVYTTNLPPIYAAPQQPPTSARQLAAYMSCSMRNVPQSECPAYCNDPSAVRDALKAMLQHCNAALIDKHCNCKRRRSRNTPQGDSPRAGVGAERPLPLRVEGKSRSRCRTVSTYDGERQVCQDTGPNAGGSANTAPRVLRPSPSRANVLRASSAAQPQARARTVVSQQPPTNTHLLVDSQATLDAKHHVTDM